jgi:hypothetical protein
LPKPSRRQDSAPSREGCHLPRISYNMFYSLEIWKPDQDMREFFYPDRIAVVGVSENPANLARGIVAHLLAFGYQGKVYPIGPRGGKVLYQVETSAKVS